MNSQLRLSLEPQDIILADTASVYPQTFSSYNA